MTSLQTALRPLDESGALRRMHAALIGGVLVSPSARTRDGSRSAARVEAAVIGAGVALPLRKVR